MRRRAFSADCGSRSSGDWWSIWLGMGRRPSALRRWGARGHRRPTVVADAKQVQEAVDIDVYEVNEGFARVPLAWAPEVGTDRRQAEPAGRRNLARARVRFFGDEAEPHCPLPQCYWRLKHNAQASPGTVAWCPDSRNRRYGPGAVRRDDSRRYGRRWRSGGATRRA